MHSDGRKTELRQELSRRGVYWDLRWGVEELSEWLKVKTTPTARSHCELSFRLEAFDIKMTPDSLVPFRRLHLRLVAGSKVLLEIPVEEISDQLPPLHRCEIPAKSRLSALEGVTLSVHVVSHDRGARHSLGCLEVKVGKFIESSELVIPDFTDLGVHYEVTLSSQVLSFTNRKFRKYVNFVIAARRISRLSGLRTAMANAQVAREIAKLEAELEFLISENDRLKKRLDVELAVENSRRSIDFYFSPSTVNREVASVPPNNIAHSTKAPLLPPAVVLPTPPQLAMSRPPDPPITRNLKLRSSEKIVIAGNPPAKQATSVPEPQKSAAAASPSVTGEAVDKLQSWYKDLNSEKASPTSTGGLAVPLVSKKTAKIDKTLELSLIEISSVVLSRETSWLSAIAANANSVFAKLEIRVLKGTRAIDFACSPLFPVKGTRLEMKPEESKISVNYISSEIDDQLLTITLFLDDAAVAVGGMHLSEIGDQEVTIALSATGDRLESDPLLTFSRFQAPIKPPAEGVNQKKEDQAPPKATRSSVVPKAKLVVPTDPKQRAIFIAQQREALAKAKQQLIANQRQQAIEEQKFVINKAKEIAMLKKAMPPLDSFKFPGMPGPPPFKPKGVPQSSAKEQPAGESRN